MLHIMKLLVTVGGCAPAAHLTLQAGAAEVVRLSELVVVC